MKRTLFLIFGVVLILLAAAPVAAQDAIVITSSQFTCDFRKELNFQVDAQSIATITRVELVIDFVETGSFRGSAKFDEGTRVRATYNWNLEQKYLPPGVTGQFWWEITDQAGNRKISAKQPFRVEDNRFKWQTLSEPRFALYWYGGDAAFGKAIFERAVSAMDALQRDTGVTVERQLQIFLYDKRADFLSALEPVVNDWVGGRAYTDHGITLIHVGANNLSFGLVATPHELTHLIIHRKLGKIGTAGFPRWLDEGLAMYYEFVPPKLETEYQTILRRAIQDDTLIPLRVLSGNFATDARQATLSYAQSFSVVDFIYRRYGKDKMTQMLLEFKQGNAFDDVFQRVLGVDTDGLESAWRQDIGAKPRAIPTRAPLAPTAFPTFALSTDLTAPTPRRDATTAPTPVARAATPAPAPTSAPRVPLNPLTQLCGGSAMLLGGVAGWAFYRRWRRAG
ncbi:MAG: peptidase MA family metallohydrolase [Anaerolineae bacterium]|nr:peptidase MA family metallohydrolase [Anaerolineae bacterium]